MHRRAVVSVKLHTRVKTARHRCVLLAVVIASLLLCAGDVELNPGPPKELPKDSMRQTRLGSSGVGRTMSLNTGSGQATSSKEPTLVDVMDMISDLTARIDNQFEEVKEEFHNLREDYQTLHGEVEQLREEVSDLRSENDSLRREKEKMAERMENLVLKVDDLEGRSRRNNLIFSGIPKVRNESNEQCESAVRSFISDKLECDGSSMEFDRVHRLNSKDDSPVIARFVFYKQKQEVLRAKGRKLKGSNFFVGEDYTFKVRDIRKRLTPHLKKARNEGKRATLVFDHLIIDGAKFCLAADDQLAEMTR